MIDTLLDAGEVFVPLLGAIVLTGVVMFGVRRIIDRTGGVARSSRWRRQIATAIVALLGLVLLVLVLPVASETRGQLIGLIGVALTGIIALSSTTFMTNAIAGLMLRIMGNFGPGDWISVGDSFGRVSEQGILHTEIQTEDRDLTTIPNILMVTQPVKVVRNSGTIISATVSLGYDAPRARVTALLTHAAEVTGLSDPFVQVLDLGDFSVTYRIAGFLEDVAALLSTRSQLRVNAMDALHNEHIEIVSPTFMNQRQTTEGVFPPFERPSEIPHNAPEEIVFDKASRAARISLVDSMIAERHGMIDAAKKERRLGDKQAAGEDIISRMEAEIAALTDLHHRLSETTDETA